MTGSSPTIRQRELGLRLRALRMNQHMTVESVAEKLLCHPTKISRAETGARRPTLRDVRDLCELYGVDGTVTAELMDLARKAREQSWWAQYDDLKLDPYIGLEQAAASITAFSMYYVPALMQTDEYAQAIINAIAPRMDTDIRQQRVTARLKRQELLEQDQPPRYRALLDEAVLHRRVGGPAIMAAQLSKVIDLEAAGKTTIQVIPFETGAYAAQDSNFVLLEFAENLPPVVFVEGLVSNSYQERDLEVDRYREAIDGLRDCALSPRESMQVLVTARDSYTDGQ